MKKPIISVLLLTLLFTFVCGTFSEGNEKLLFPSAYPREYNRGRDFIIAHDYDQAIDFFSKQMSIEPENAVPRMFLGLTYFLKRDYGLAAREIVMAANLNDSILAPNNDLIVELGWNGNNYTSDGRAMAFIPRYRIDDVISCSGTIHVKSFREEMNELIRQLDTATFNLTIEIKSPREKGLILALLKINKINFSSSFRKLNKALLSHEFPFLYSPVFGFVRLEEQQVIERQEGALIVALIRTLFPSFPPQYVKPNATITAMEYGINEQFYAGVTHFQKIRGDEVYLSQKLLLYPVPNTLRPEDNGIDRNIVASGITGLARTIQYVSQSRETSTETGKSLSDSKITINAERIAYDRGRVELPLFPSGAVALAGNQDIPTPEENTENRHTPFHDLLYHAPEFSRLDEGPSRQNSTTPALSDTPQDELPVDEETESPSESNNSSSLLYTPPQDEQNDPDIDEVKRAEFHENKALDHSIDTSTESSFRPQPTETPSVIRDSSSTENRNNPSEEIAEENIDYENMIITTIPESVVDEDEDQISDTDFSSHSAEKKIILSKVEQDNLSTLLNSIALPLPELEEKNTQEPTLEGLPGMAQFKDGVRQLKTAAALPEDKLLTRGEYVADALNKFEQAIQNSTDTALMYELVGTNLFNHGLYPDALDAFQKGLALSKTPELYAGAALSYAALDTKLVKAIVLAKKALSKSENAQNYLVLGWLYIKKNYMKWAKETFDKALELDNRRSELYFYRGYASLALNDIAAAKNDFTLFQQGSSEKNYQTILNQIKESVPEIETK